MKLFSLNKEYQVIWEPQIALMVPFAAILKRDKSKTKTKATKELAFIYFYTDIKSDYAIHTDLVERTAAIKADLLLDSKWKIDKVIQTAIDFYRKRSKSLTAKILEDSTYVANKVSSRLREAVDDDLDIADLDKVLNGLKKIPDVIKSLKIAEREVLREIEEAQDSIGSKEKALFEDLQLHG